MSYSVFQNKCFYIVTVFSPRGRRNSTVISIFPHPFCIIVCHCAFAAYGQRSIPVQSPYKVRSIAFAAAATGSNNIVKIRNASAVFRFLYADPVTAYNASCFFFEVKTYRFFSLGHKIDSRFANTVFIVIINIESYNISNFYFHVRQFRKGKITFKIPLNIIIALHYGIREKLYRSAICFIIKINAFLI